MHPLTRLLAVILNLALLAPATAQEPRRVTIVYDAFGAPSSLVKDWGYAAFAEYGGCRQAS